MDKLSHLQSPTISAANSFEAYFNIEENLLSQELSPRIPFISDEPSNEAANENNAENTLYTLKVRTDNEKKFLAEIEEIFCNSDPIWQGKFRFR